MEKHGDATVGMKDAAVREAMPTAKLAMDLYQFLHCRPANLDVAYFENETGERDFTYSLAVTKLTGPYDAEAAKKLWREDPTIARSLAGCEFSFLTMRGMWDELQETLTTTPAPSEIGRLAQLLKAAGVDT